ncbi:MAG: nucleotidyltransferase domain-containing protein [Candidatus Nealsonbacteria bacterium]|nr:nucleotidyltransferase domain-containing protein [Candidatus Nealsonbacteria bacterium]
MDDQKRVENFLQDFSRQLSQRAGGDLDFILLFGSAARGEWRRGISDIDLIIQVKDSKKKKWFLKEAENIFWELDKKYETKFDEVCSTGGKKEAINNILEKTRLYVPFQVFGPGDIDWSKSEIKEKSLVIGAKLFASQAMIFKNMKYEGKILYGRDIKKEIQFKATLWEKIKALLIPFYIAFFSIFVSLFFPKTALKLSDKAVIYSIGSTFFFLDKLPRQNLKENVQELEKEIHSFDGYKFNIFLMAETDFLLSFAHQNFLNFQFVKDAIKIKHNWQEESKKFGRWRIFKFCSRTLLFVNSMNWYAILRADKQKIFLKTLFVLRTAALLIIICFLLYYLIK